VTTTKSPKSRSNDTLALFPTPMSVTSTGSPKDGLSAKSAATIVNPGGLDMAVSNGI
jgi:hypothetical protein